MMRFRRKHAFANSGRVSTCNSIDPDADYESQESIDLLDLTSVAGTPAGPAPDFSVPMVETVDESSTEG